MNDLTLQDEGIFRLRACIDEDSTVCGAIEFRLSVKNDIILAVDPVSSEQLLITHLKNNSTLAIISLVLDHLLVCII